MIALNVAGVVHRGVPLFELQFLSFKCFGALRVLKEFLYFGHVCGYSELNIFRAEIIDFVTQSLRAWVIVLYFQVAFFRVDWKEGLIEVMSSRPICVFMNGISQALKRLYKLLRLIKASVYDNLKFFR